LEFSNGEKAYATAISYRDNVVSEARAFIDNTKDDLQMRFAMRLLGDLRATEAIPTLIAHLNWKYCDSNLIEDACPAVYSLRLIGRDAIEPLIKDLLSRQQLPPEYSSVAAYVMQSILGKDDAKRFISEKIRAATGQGTARLEALLKEIECFAAKPDTAPPGQEARMTQ
jgi:hypothetical protein